MPELWQKAEEAKNAFGQEWWQRALGMGQWSGKSIGKMAASVGLRDLYRQVYAKACEATHGSDATDHVYRDEAGNFTLSIMAKDDCIQYCLDVGNTVFSDILLDLITALQLQDANAWIARVGKYRIAENDWNPQ